MAARAMMGAERFTILVEGKDFDASYYDRLLAADETISSQGFHIVRAHEVSDAEVGNGGKQYLYQLHDFYLAQDTLVFNTKSGNKYLVFFLDRDFDGFYPGLRESNHIVYTYTPDVEAEIFRRGNIARALSTALSLTSAEAQETADKLGQFVLDLSILWREWITLCIATAPLRSRCQVQPSRASRVNADTYGNFDPQAHSDLYAELIRTSQVEDPEEVFSRISNAIDDAYAEVRFHQIVKGKWIAGYVLHVISQNQDIGSRDRHVERRILAAMLDSIDFLGRSHHARQLSKLAA
ncbi:hypothetical protein ACIPY1_14310 [Paenarthrobacter nicotinovorans]|uniref:hypothetical protein n=1 Tax=Paenarthrobacter nicotinovorans TaxID=29320 RepID=UPI00382CA367